MNQNELIGQDLQRIITDMLSEEAARLLKKDTSIKRMWVAASFWKKSTKNLILARITRQRTTFGFHSHSQRWEQPHLILHYFLVSEHYKMLCISISHPLPNWLITYSLPNVNPQNVNSSRSENTEPVSSVFFTVLLCPFFRNFSNCANFWRARSAGIFLHPFINARSLSVCTGCSLNIFFRNFIYFATSFASTRLLLAVQKWSTRVTVHSDLLRGWVVLLHAVNWEKHNFLWTPCMSLHPIYRLSLFPCPIGGVCSQLLIW